MDGRRSLSLIKIFPLPYSSCQAPHQSGEMHMVGEEGDGMAGIARWRYVKGIGALWDKWPVGQIFHPSRTCLCVGKLVGKRSWFFPSISFTSDELLVSLAESTHQWYLWNAGSKKYFTKQQWCVPAFSFWTCTISLLPGCLCDIFRFSNYPLRMQRSPGSFHLSGADFFLVIFIWLLFTHSYILNSKIYWNLFANWN